MKRPLIVIFACIGFLIFSCCLCIFAFASGSLFYGLAQTENFSFELGAGTPTPTPIVLRPTVQPTQITEGTPETNSQLEEQIPTPEEELNDPTLAGMETLRTLEDTLVPINDLIDLAERLQGKENIPLTVEAPPTPFQVGEMQTFWVTNVDSNESFQIEATLQYVTEHAYFWIEEGARFDQEDLEVLAERFESEIYPTNREFFGSEWTPGVDGDPHLYVIYAGGLGFGLAGYFSSADEVHPQAHEYSNAHEAFLLNADTVGLGDDLTLGILAHEFQHMIHWYRDRNEASWLNEGFSELAAFINGFDVGLFDDLYANNPDLQLNDWPNDSSATSPHYGAGFLFLNYFLNRFGDEATQALVSHPENGMSSVDAVLDEMEIVDPLSGEPIEADDVFVDWVLTNFLADGDLADGRYAYHNYPGVPSLQPTETIDDCPTETLTRDVHQYGVDYIQITCPGDYTLSFEGSIQVQVVPEDPHSGEYVFWSNKGDESDMTLTQKFDFRDHAGPLTLTYWTWYDIEADYDYLYLEASRDGEDWQILTTPSGTAEDPSGNSYGWAYNGLSGGSGVWIHEEVDLTQFGGEQVQIRFEYVTDAAVNGEGFLLDDIAVPEVGYASDFEADSGGWEPAGFVRIKNLLPQRFRLALITKGESTSVEYISLSSDNSAQIPLHIDGEVEEAVLVVTGTTRYTRQKAPYRFEITP